MASESPLEKLVRYSLSGGLPVMVIVLSIVLGARKQLIALIPRTATLSAKVRALV